MKRTYLEDVICAVNSSIHIMRASTRMIYSHSSDMLFSPALFGIMASNKMEYKGE
jgi:hypothetical protein